MANLIISLLICMGMLTGCQSVETPPEKSPEPITKAEYHIITSTVLLCVEIFKKLKPGVI